MPGQLMAELFAFLGEAAIRGGIAAYRGLRADTKANLSALLGAATPARQRATLDIIAATVLMDGRISDTERTMLASRRSDTSSDLVDESLATALEVTPFKDAEAVRAFVEQRSKILDQGLRDQVLVVVVETLGGSDDASVAESLKAIAAGLGDSSERVEEIRNSARAAD